MPPSVLDPESLTVESLIPHRGRMLLVGKIIHLDGESATTLSIAHRSWPLFKEGTINPLVMVELVAQTAGVHNGMKRLQIRGEGSETRGWLVGIKKAVFHVSSILIGTRITTTARNAFVFDNLREIRGMATIGGKAAAEVILQVVEAAE
jgi:predicted hotdog family 3-hydroxylacyl-ACP dehydratase